MPGKKGSGGGGILEGLVTLVEKLSELERRGERLERSGRIGGSDGKVRGSYDIEVRVGLGDEAAGESPSRRDDGEGKVTRSVPVQPIREPFVDVFEEEAGTVVVAQLPGVPCEEVVLELEEDILLIRADHEELRYRKELLLPRSFSQEEMKARCRNGVLEIRLAGEEGAAP